MDNNSAVCKVYLVFGFACLLLLFFDMDNYHALEPADNAHHALQEPAHVYMVNITTRKLLQDFRDGNNSTVNRIGTPCSTRNIYIEQRPDTPLPNGIPVYAVALLNHCVDDQGSCTIYDIHLSCGWFSTARLINPQIFRRIAFDDCIVKDGQPINPGESVYFKYANTFEYPMSVSSMKCLT